MEQEKKFSDLFRSNEMTDEWNSFFDKMVENLMLKSKDISINFIVNVVESFCKNHRGMFSNFSYEGYLSLANTIYSEIQQKNKDNIDRILTMNKNVFEMSNNARLEYIRKLNELDGEKIEFEGNVYRTENKIREDRETIGLELSKIKETKKEIDSKKLENSELSTENRILKDQIQAQSVSIQGYKEQIKDLVEKLAAITTAAVTPSSISITNQDE